MRKDILRVLCSVIILVFAGGCTMVKVNHLTIRGGDPVTYQCANGERIVARYYALSDKSLGFVKLRLADGTEYTLPQVVSGSGVRYSDDRDMVWWTKGETAFAEMRDDNGEWRTVHESCAEMPEKQR